MVRLGETHRAGVRGITDVPADPSSAVRLKREQPMPNSARIAIAQMTAG